VYEWDEAKREANLRKHGYDFADADLVYENPAKLALFTARQDEPRLLDIAIVELHEVILTFVYIVRGYVSFRSVRLREGAAHL
jgi:hypothetical protein